MSRVHWTIDTVKNIHLRWKAILFVYVCISKTIRIRESVELYWIVHLQPTFPITTFEMFVLVAITTNNKPGRKTNMALSTKNNFPYTLWNRVNTVFVWWKVQRVYRTVVIAVKQLKWYANMNSILFENLLQSSRNCLYWLKAISFLRF